MRELRLTVIAVLTAAAFAGCSDNASPGREERSATVVEACSGHGGVVAFDDDAVICEDQTARGARAGRAVDACREHRGVSAFDDDIVICRDQTVHRAEEG